MIENNIGRGSIRGNTQVHGLDILKSFLLRGKGCQDICSGILLWVHVFLCPIVSIFNVIRPPLSLDQKHLSTVEVIFLFGHSCSLSLFMMTPSWKGSHQVTFTIQESVQTTNIHVKWKPGQMAIPATENFFVIVGG